MRHCHCVNIRPGPFHWLLSDAACDIDPQQQHPEVVPAAAYVKHKGPR